MANGQAARNLAGDSRSVAYDIRVYLDLLTQRFGHPACPDEWDLLGSVNEELRSIAAHLEMAVNAADEAIEAWQAAERFDPDEYHPDEAAARAAREADEIAAGYGMHFANGGIAQYREGLADNYEGEYPTGGHFA